MADRKQKWDDFLGEVEQASTNKGPGCGVGIYLSSLPSVAANTIHDAMVRPELTTSAIAKAIKNRGGDVSTYTLRRHRRGECACPKNGQ